MFKKYGATDATTLKELAQKLTLEAETKQSFSVIYVTEEDDKYEALFEHISAVC